MPTKLLAFAVSSFYCGVAGALYAFCYLGSVEPDGFSLEMSFKILFMIIIGGVGSIMGLPRGRLHPAAADLPRYGPAVRPASSGCPFPAPPCRTSRLRCSAA
jgi:hypothetical protein